MFGGAERNLDGIQHGGIIKTPLHQIHDGQDGGNLRGLTRLKHRLLAASQLPFSARRLEIYRAIDEVQTRDAVDLGDGEVKFRAPNGTGRQRSLKFHIGRLFAIQKIKRAAPEPKTVAGRRCRRLEFENGGLVDADDAAVGKLQGRTAVNGRLEPIARVQE